VPNFLEIEETLCGPTDVRTDGFTDRHLRLTSLGQLCQIVHLKTDISITDTNRVL